MLFALTALLSAVEPAPAGSITLEVESPRAVTLFEVLDQDRVVLDEDPMSTLVVSTLGRPHCVAPCVVTVPRASRYYVAAPDMPTSKIFTVEDRPDRTKVKVLPGDPTLRMLSRAAGVVSLLLVGAGIIGFASGVLVQGTARVPQVAVGSLSIGLGLAVGIAGLWAWFVPGKTRVLLE